MTHTPEQTMQITDAKHRAEDLRALGQSEENIRFALGTEGFAAECIRYAMAKTGKESE